jgi:hypothetical protein
MREGRGERMRGRGGVREGGDRKKNERERSKNESG